MVMEAVPQGDYDRRMSPDQNLSFPSRSHTFYVQLMFTYTGRLVDNDATLGVYTFYRIQLVWTPDGTHSVLFLIVDNSLHQTFRSPFPPLLWLEPKHNFERHGGWSNFRSRRGRMRHSARCPFHAILAATRVRSSTQLDHLLYPPSLRRNFQDKNDLTLYVQT